MKKQMMAGYLVLREGQSKMHGSVRCELADNTQEARDAACKQAVDQMRERFHLEDDSQVRIVALFDAPVQSVKEM
jgi:hypothetical protein